MTDTVFFRNLHPNAYTETDARGVTIAGGSNPAKGNVVIPGIDPADAPVVSIVRSAPVMLVNGLRQNPVTALDPRPANEAVASEALAPDDGFYTPAQYRGGFHPNGNWLYGWTADDGYGFIVTFRT